MSKYVSQQRTNFASSVSIDLAEFVHRSKPVRYLKFLCQDSINIYGNVKV